MHIVRYELSTVFVSNFLYVSSKLGLDHLVKFNQTSASLVLVLNEKNPYGSTKIVNDHHEVIGMCKGWCALLSPHVTMYKVKTSTSFSVTNRKWKSDRFFFNIRIANILRVQRNIFNKTNMRKF